MHDWQEWIGKTSISQAVLAPEQANAMAVTLDRTPDFRVGDKLPPAWHWLYFHDLVRASELGPEGHPQLGLFLPPVPLPRRMWAGGSLVFRQALRLGDSVERRSIISSITPKAGRSGPLYFVTIEHTLRAHGQLCLVEEQTLVYRELAPAERQPQHVPAGAEYTQRYLLDSVALFRYSALTFNAHRIHYDVDYCRKVEGYPDLVIHGPLIATLLLDLYIQQNQPLARFRYRARNPLFLPHPFTVNGKSDGQVTRLWANDHQGWLAMDAETSQSHE